MGAYTLAATFDEGCTANYPPPDSGTGCTATGASQLKFDGQKVRWMITNDGEAHITLDGLTLTWPVENGKLKKINVDGAVRCRISWHHVALLEEGCMRPARALTRSESPVTALTEAKTGRPGKGGHPGQKGSRETCRRD